MTKIIGLVQIKGGAGRSTVRPIPRECIHKKIRMKAIEEDCTVTDIIAKLLEQEVK